MRIRRFFTADVTAILLLLVLWLLFFWRLFTPVEADQTSLKQGDFSGQFVAFAAYQYERLAAGEVPLWNPYNNGGLPFLADTQSAVFYPPRLLTIGLSKLAGGWTYHALELEMTAHVLVYSLFMYLLVTRLTIKREGSVLGAFVAAVIAGYGGFLTSYPPLQLALLEAAIWMPLAVLGVHEATRNERLGWNWLVLTGIALGLSWMAGHPQTSWFLTYLLVAYFGYRSYQKRYRLTSFASGVILFGVIAGGMAAVQLLPGLEYLTRTSRTEFGFDAKGNGFPFRDIVQFIFPNIMSQWSPLYIGITGLVLSGIALYRKLPGVLFWGLVAVVSLGLSFGANSPIFAVLYNVLPGMRYFRGQERAVVLVANSLAILAGMGIMHLTLWKADQWPTATRNIRRGLVTLVSICAGAVVLVFNEWLNNHNLLNDTLSTVIFSATIAVLTLGLIWSILQNSQIRLYHWLLAALLVFELFTVNMDTDSNYDPLPPTQQLSLTPPPLIAQVAADEDVPFRVDGYRGLHDNYGSFYQVADIRGISPLFLDSTHAIIQTDLINPLAWELFAVRYVFTDWDTLPVSSKIIGSGEDRYGAVNLHRLDEARPFGLMIYDTVVAASDEEARTIMSGATFDAHRTAILNSDPGMPSQNEVVSSAEVTVTHFEPEQFIVEVNTLAEGILSVANPDYPGWGATIDGRSTEILRAYGALQAVVVPAGKHIVTFTFDPLTYRIGAIISLFTWGALGILGLIFLSGRVQYARNKHATKLG